MGRFFPTNSAVFCGTNMGKNITKSTPKPNSVSRRSSNKVVSPTKMANSYDHQTPGPSNLRKVHKKIVDDTPTTEEPPEKRSRLELNSTLDIGEEENSRRRRTLKHGELPSPVCTLCKEDQKPESEPLKECSSCKAKYHVGKCLRYKSEFSTNIHKLSRWLCARCIECHGCGNFIADPSNIECTICCRAWHGVCAPKGYSPTDDYDADWYCPTCCRDSGIKTLYSPKRAYKAPLVAVNDRKSRREMPKPKDELEFQGDIEELKDLLNKRDFTWELLNHEAGFSAVKPDPFISSKPVAFKKAKRGRKPASAEEDFDYSNITKDTIVPKVVRRDLNLFEKTKKEAYSQKPSSSVHPNGQFLHFGTGKACKAVYTSAYEEPLYSAPHLYSCKFCLHTTHRKEDLIIHWDHCNSKHPPGNEIYRDDDLAFFEVDGAAQKKYCQDLCLLAKLFIASKTLYAEVETFIFYVLCEITTEGYVIVGYFSKEKNPSKNNNLSCLLVLPMVQKMGYGRLLIDMSYELSRLEHRIGHPEHPLSDLGILAYRGYWRSSLLCYLREHRNSERLNIKDISLATRITPTDIVNQLMLDNLIVLKGGVYSIKIGKRALKLPLSHCRRRYVDTSKLTWAPKPTKEQLDPTKINSYV